MTAEILGIIPARGGSKGVQRKNLHPLAGRPLIEYTIEAAGQSQRISRLVVSTEDEEIARLAEKWGCEVITRPKELANDETPMVPVIQHVLQSLREERYSPDVTLILQPTAPLRRAQHINEALDLLLSSDANSVVSVTAISSHHHPEWQFTIDEAGLLKTISGKNLTQIQPRRQDLKPTYTRNGAIYAFRSEAFEKADSLYPSPCLAYIMSSDVSVNIDLEEDFWLAERYLLDRK